MGKPGNEGNRNIEGDVGMLFLLVILDLRDESALRQFTIGSYQQLQRMFYNML